MRLNKGRIEVRRLVGISVLFSDFHQPRPAFTGIAVGFLMQCTVCNLQMTTVIARNFKSNGNFCNVLLNMHLWHSFNTNQKLLLKIKKQKGSCKEYWVCTYIY